MIHLDSSFVIDLMREQARRPGKAMTWLQDHGSDPLGVSMFVICELEAGAMRADDPDDERARVHATLQTVANVMPDERFPRKYGALLHTLQRRGRVIGVMDLLIATAAVLDDAPLLTSNENHFEDVPNLRVLTYR